MNDLEKRIVELEEEIQLLRQIIEQLRKEWDANPSSWPQKFPLPKNPYEPIPAPLPDPYKPNPWGPTVVPNEPVKPWMPHPATDGYGSCPKCGLKLDRVMGYVCGALDCPTFMRPSFSSS